MNLANIGRALRLAYFWRVPFTMIAILAALGPALYDTGPLANILDQGPTEGLTLWMNLSLVSFAAFILASTGVATLNLTRYYGDARFGVEIDPHITWRPLICG